MHVPKRVPLWVCNRLSSTFSISLWMAIPVTGMTGKCHFITNLKKEKMMLNRLVQIQANHPLENIIPAPRLGQCHRLSTGLLLCPLPDRAAFHIPTGAITDLPHAHSRLHCPSNAHSPPARWNGVPPMRVPTLAVPHTWPKQIFERFVFSSQTWSLCPASSSFTCLLSCLLASFPSFAPSSEGECWKAWAHFKGHLLV